MSREDVIGLSVLALIVVLILFFSFRASLKSTRAQRAKQSEETPAIVDIAQATTTFTPARQPLMTIALIAISVLVTISTGMGESLRDLEHWIIASPGSEGLADVLGGEVWRLITPIFIHFGPIHLLFNMIWLWDLGGIIEDRKGRVMFGAFILVVGLLSNLTQYLVGGSPYFGGMSGVVYGLLSYVWIQGRLNPGFGYTLHKQTVIMMVGWFVLCWTGLLGPIANWAHTAGLVAGIAWGYAEVSMSRYRASKL